MLKFFLPIFLLVPSLKTITVNPVSHTTLSIAEPSGICVGDNGNYFVASNNGVLCEINSLGKVLRSEKLGMDIEDLCIVDSNLYVMDESLRLVYVLNKTTWKQIGSHMINYNGAANKGFESITYLPKKKHFILITEKEPILLMETDTNFNVINQFQINNFSDMSSATYYNDKLWLLSDEDHTVIKMNPDDFTIEKKWSVPVFNPEGICFGTDSTMHVVSDDCRRLYNFPNPEK